MLFADIEGSTRLLRAIGGDYLAVVTRKRRLMREIVAAAHGVEVDATGDAAFFAFASAVDALSAAASIHRRLASEPWPGGQMLRVRIGVHTGEPEVGDEGYVGIDVHRASRICAAAHGGQVVVSQRTRDLIEDTPPPGLSLVPLGVHRLKDFPRATALFQLAGEGLEETFAPLKTLGGAALPAPHHRLVGRHADNDAVERLLQTDGVRLVTLTGPGGAGKSRLALEIAANHADRRPVSLVGLASISDTALVPAAIARAVGVRESPERPLVDEIAASLQGQDALLVLDNLEHLPEAVGTIGQLLDRTTDLRVLATSRAPLRLSAERVYRVAPLAVDEAATLFTELADARGTPLPDDSDAVVHAICRRLDGLPLAIELVTARLALLSPAALLDALDDGLALVAEGPVDLPERQRTLRATIDWSYGLLTPGQRELHCRLAVFAAGCTIDDATKVCGRDRNVLADLEALVEGSLIRVDGADPGGARISMLETVREYATERLAGSGLLDEAQRRHMLHFLELAVAAEEGLTGPDQRHWLDRLEAEHDNLRAALQQALRRDEVDAALRAVAATSRFWRAHGHIEEAQGWLRAGLDSAGRVDDETRGRALWTSARLAMAQGRAGEAVPLLEQSLATFTAVGDAQSAVFARCELSLAHMTLGELDEAEQAAADALVGARRLRDPRALSAALNTMGGIAVERDDYERARDLYAESLAVRRTLDDPLLVVNSANNLGLAAFRQGDHGAAVAALDECLELARHLGDELHAASALCALGEIALIDGEPGRARALLVEALDLYVDLDDPRMIAECLHALGGVGVAAGDAETAAFLWGGAEALRDELGVTPVREELAVHSLFDTQVRENLDAHELERARDGGRQARLEDLVARARVRPVTTATRDGGKSDG
jgi:predicted ATPase/class 3 adenylate cyclase